MKIKTGEYEVVFSGSVVMVDNKPVEFQFPETHASLRIILSFKEDSNVEGSPIEFHPNQETKTLELVIINSKGLNNFGNTTLLEIGFLQNRKLYLNYRVLTIGNISNTIHYTFYLGEEGSYVG